MDPITAAVVMPLIVRYAGHLAGLAGKVADETVMAGLRKVWATVTARFSADPQAKGALDRLATDPENRLRQAAVEDHLTELLAKDPEFATQLSELVREASGSAYSDIRVRDAGAVAIGGDVRLTAGGHAAGRDLTIGQSPEPTPEPG